MVGCKPVLAFIVSLSQSWRRCTADEATCALKLEEGVGFTANDTWFDKRTYPSVEECCAWCGSEQVCGAFSYHKGSGVCTIGKHVVQSGPKADTVSGRKSSAPLPPSPSPLPPSPSPGAKKICSEVVNDLPGKDFSQNLQMRLPNGLLLNANDLGIDGHITTRTQCSIYDKASGSFGWTYDSGHTTKNCGKPAKEATKCPYQVYGTDPKCLYQFSYHGVMYDMTNMGLSADTTKLKHLYTDVDVNYTWTDVSQPPVTKPPSYRSRLIYDFFLTNTEPKKFQHKQIGITDEIIIDLGYNKDFQVPCGYRGQSAAPLQTNFIQTAAGNFDLMDISERDKVCKGCKDNVRMTHFRRQGGECSGNGECPVNANLDLMLFIDKVRQYDTKSRQQPSGKWLGIVDLGTEISDNTKAEVMVKKFDVQVVHESSLSLVTSEVLV